MVLTLIPSTIFVTGAVAPITDETIQTRIDELDRLLSGKYFTVNGEGCCEWVSNHGCSNCNVNRVIKSQWFKNMFGTVEASQFFLSGGMSCMGFVEFAEWYIFRYDNSDRVLRESSVKYEGGFNYNTIAKNADKGDYIRVSGHSFILISTDSTGVEVLDCNSYSTNNCIVKRHRIEFSNKNYSGKTIYISKMSSKIAGTPVRNSGSVETPTVSTRMTGKWTVTIPANYKLLCSPSAEASKDTTYIKKMSDSYKLSCTEKATLSNGKTRFFFVSGDKKSLWFDLTSNMSVTHVSHKGQFQYFSNEHPHFNYYTCSICGETFTDDTTSYVESCSICNPPPEEPNNDNCWSPWSDWTTTPADESDTREVETKTVTTQVKIADGYTEYRYVGYATTDGRHECWCETYLRNKFGSAVMRYSDWSTKRYSVNGTGWSCGNCSGNHINVGHYGSDGRAWWPEYTLPDGKNYYWEESRTIDAKYETRTETQYRYRNKTSC